MHEFTKEQLCNRAYISRALAFNTQLPISQQAGTMPWGGARIPQGVVMNPDGSALVRYYAPGARELSVRMMDDTVYPMVKDAEGLWSVTIPCTVPGWRAMFFTLDGCEVINPYAPIGFGWSKPINYIEFPEEGCNFYLLKDVPHGTVAEDIYYSTFTGQYESCVVYLPPDYLHSDKRYPVLYLQHGHGENEQTWVHQGKVNYIMDNLIAEGKAIPCIIVMNNGMVHTTAPDGTPAMDSTLLEQLLIRDCIPFIENRYRTLTGRQDRAMAGLSMGSMQTSVITMKHPELFAYAGIFSGFLRALPGMGTNDHMAAMENAEKFRQSYKVFFRAIGDNDRFIDIFLEESRLMKGKNLSAEQWSGHVLRRYPGEHEWQVWRKCLYDFSQLIFR